MKKKQQKTSMDLFWYVEEPYPNAKDGGEEWNVSIAGYFCFLSENRSSKKRRWCWSFYYDDNDERRVTNNVELAGGYATSSKQASRALLSALRKHTRKQLEGLEILHGRRSGTFKSRYK